MTVDYRVRQRAQMLQRFKGIFFRQPQGEEFVESKYFEKYKNSVDGRVIRQLLKEYESSDLMFEPPRAQLTRSEEEALYRSIDESDLASPQEKYEAVIGLITVLDGSFPQPRLVAHLEKVFGREFVQTIEAKRDEFKSEIAAKKLTRIVKQKREWKRH